MTVSHVRKIKWSPLLQPCVLVTALILVLVTLTCPDPLSSSGVTLITISPANLTNVSDAATGAASPSASAVTTFGASDSANVSTASSDALDPASTAATNSSSASESTTPTATTSSTLNNTTSATPLPRSRRAMHQAISTLYHREVEPQPASSLVKNDSLSFNDDLGPVRLERINVTDDQGNTTAASNNTAAGTPVVTTGGFVVRNVPTGERLSAVELKFGPLGSCYRSSTWDRVCTPASLQPTFDSSGITAANDQGLRFNTSGLPEDMRTTPILLLVVFVLLSMLVALAIPSTLARLCPGRFAHILENKQWTRIYAQVTQLALYARLAIALLLLGTGVSMRIVASKAVYAFNAANAGVVLPGSLILLDVPNPLRDTITLRATVGRAFSMFWASVALLAIEFWLERSRIRREEAVRIARGDLEAKWGREVLEQVQASKNSAAAAPMTMVDLGKSAGNAVTHPIQVRRKAAPAYKGPLEPIVIPRNTVHAPVYVIEDRPSTEHNEIKRSYSYDDVHWSHPQVVYATAAPPVVTYDQQDSKPEPTYYLPREERAGRLLPTQSVSTPRRPFGEYAQEQGCNEGEDQEEVCGVGCRHRPDQGQVVRSRSTSPAPSYWAAQQQNSHQQLPQSRIAPKRSDSSASFASAPMTRLPSSMGHQRSLSSASQSSLAQTFHQGAHAEASTGQAPLRRQNTAPTTRIEASEPSRTQAHGHGHGARLYGSVSERLQDDEVCISMAAEGTVTSSMAPATSSPAPSPRIGLRNLRYVK